MNQIYLSCTGSSTGSGGTGGNFVKASKLSVAILLSLFVKTPDTSSSNDNNEIILQINEWLMNKVLIIS